VHRCAALGIFEEELCERRCLGRMNPADGDRTIRNERLAQLRPSSTQALKSSQETAFLPLDEAAISF
jgi:hypothetical protein